MDCWEQRRDGFKIGKCLGERNSYIWIEIGVPGEDVSEFQNIAKHTSITSIQSGALLHGEIAFETQFCSPSIMVLDFHLPTANLKTLRITFF